MAAHETAYHVKMPFGKYKGQSMGYIFDVDSSYLTWISSTKSMPTNWRELADKTLTRQPLPLPKNYVIPAAPKVQVFAATKGKLAVTFPYNRSLVERLKVEIDGRKWNGKETRWEFPEEQIIPAIRLFGEVNTTLDAHAKKVYATELLRKDELNVIREKEDSPEMIVKLKSLLKLAPYNYQNTGVEFADRANGRAIIADSMGLGKSIQSIAYAMLHNLKTIIVCPKSVAPHWKKEIKKFTGKNSVTWTTTEKEGNSRNQFHITTYEAVAVRLKELNAIGFDLLVCDEATYLKNRTTKRSKSVLGYYDKTKRKQMSGIKAKYCLFLTGTPVMNRPEEIFHLLNYIDKNRFNNFYQFVQKYGGWRGEPTKNLDELHERTKDLVIRRLKKDVAKDLPPKQRNDLVIEMTSADMKEYNKHLKELFNKWKAHGKPTVAEMPAIQSYLWQKKKDRTIEMINELIEADRSILIFSVYLEPLFELEKLYKDDSAIVHGKQNSKQRQQSIDDLSSGKKKIGLFSTGAGAMGIDGLQNKIDTVLFLNFWWVPAVHEQAEDRVHRNGQTNPVQIFYFICEHTIDEYMRELLEEKLKIIETITDGKLITAGNVKRSFFKEFVQKLSVNYQSLMSKIDISGDLDEDIEDLED